MTKPVLCLLIAAHNESAVIANTLQSAIVAGLDPKHIYVVDDNSDDNTSEVARTILGKQNVIRVRRSGKGLALAKGAKKFNLAARYRWIHIADADGGFAPDYFRVFRRELRVSNAAATGYIKSLPGSIVGQYRVLDYTIGMDIVRRFQSMTGMISIIPGPTSCFRADVFAQLKFGNGALAEDFDVTLQIHRKKLGTIQFIDDAIAYTHDPISFKDFVKQIRRWNRGVLQAMFAHRVGLHLHKLDAYLWYQVGMSLTMFVSYGIILPFAASQSNTLEAVSMTFLVDALVTAVAMFLVALRSGRWDIINAFPHLYAYRWVSLLIFIYTFVEVAIFGRYRTKHSRTGIWEGVSRAAS